MVSQTDMKATIGKTPETRATANSVRAMSPSPPRNQPRLVRKKAVSYSPARKVFSALRALRTFLWFFCFSSMWSRPSKSRLTMRRSPGERPETTCLSLWTTKLPPASSIASRPLTAAETKAAEKTRLSKPMRQTKRAAAGDSPSGGR